MDRRTSACGGSSRDYRARARRRRSRSRRREREPRRSRPPGWGASRNARGPLAAEARGVAATVATASRIKMTYTAVLPAGRSIHDAQLAAVLQANGRAHLLAMDARAVEEERERFDDDNQSARVQAPQACLRVRQFSRKPVGIERVINPGSLPRGNYRLITGNYQVSANLASARRPGGPVCSRSLPSKGREDASAPSRGYASTKGSVTYARGMGG
jgi:hypothetical protein